MLRKGDLDYVLDILDVRHAASVSLGLHIVFAEGVVKLADDVGGDILGLLAGEGTPFLFGGGLAGLVDGSGDLPGGEGDNHAVALAEFQEGCLVWAFHCGVRYFWNAGVWVGRPPRSPPCSR